MTTFWAIIFIIVCILLITVVLLQKGRGGGLGGILGGGGGQSAFGTRTGDVFTWITIILVGIFLLLAIGTTKLFRGGEMTKISTPDFYPPPKPITKAKLVTITCRQKADIFYTVDGSEPTRKSWKYETPVHVAPGTILKALALNPEWKDSDIRTGEYPHPSTITTIAPATTMPASAPATGTAPN